MLATEPVELPASPVLVGVSPSIYSDILAGARLQEFDRGEVLYFQGDAAGQIILLVSGFVKVAQLGANGGEVILRVAVPGDVLAATDALRGGRHCTSAQAFRPSRAYTWDAPVFRALVQRFPILHQNLVRILGDNLLELEERFLEVATERVDARVARQLVRLVNKIGRSVRGELEIELTREQLAQMTGTTLFTVSRLFSAWEVRGAVKPRREAVTICDIHSLRAISEERC